MCRTQPLVPTQPATDRVVGKFKRPSRYMAAPTPQKSFDDSQEWLQSRLDHIHPEDFPSAVAFYSARPVMPPSGFEHVWQCIGEHHRNVGVPSADEFHLLCSAELLVVFADVSEESQVNDVKAFWKFVASFFRNSRTPFSILVQHSVAPELRVRETSETMEHASVDITRSGTCDLIIEESASFKLVWAVQNSLLRQQQARLNVHACPEWKNELEQDKQKLQLEIDYIFWDYLRKKMKTGIPCVDPAIAPGLPEVVGGKQVSACIGEGRYGAVHRLMQDGDSSGEVLKVVAKRSLSSLHDMKSLRRHIDVMILVSSRFPHPNIIKLHNVLHSKTHLLFQMEDGGSRNLRRRLSHRDNRRSPLSSLGVHKAQAIISQMISAIAHMHIKAKACHRDIKPENIIVSEAAEDIHIKITDFDTAIINPRVPCYGIVGTFPFMAPEMLLEEVYNPYAADVWSMAIVILEIACCSDVLEESLGLSWPHSHQMMAMAAEIQQYFQSDEAITQLLNKHLHPALKELSCELESILPGMLQVQSSDRASSEKILQAFRIGPQ